MCMPTNLHQQINFKVLGKKHMMMFASFTEEKSQTTKPNATEVTLWLFVCTNVTSDMGMFHYQRKRQACHANIITISYMDR